MKNEKFRNPEAILDVQDKPTFPQWLLLSVQHLFTMFGSTVLVPLLIGMNPSIALFSSGVGTLVYILCTRAKIPAYLGSSFAFIMTMQALMKSEGYPAVGQGAIAAGLVYVIVSLIIGKFGSQWVDKVLPPVVVGPIVIFIGLSLATTAANDAMFNNNHYDLKYFGVAIFTLVATIIFNMFLRGFSSMIPVLLGIIVGYIFAVFMGIVDLSGVAAAKWFSLPAFDVMFVNYDFKWYPGAIIGMAPIAFVTMTEHMGHVMVLNKLTKRNFFKNPGLHRTLLGDGLSSIIAGFVDAGEDLESTVKREVFEEVGIKIKNIKYYGNQTWAFPNSLMIGFFAEYESVEIKVDGREILDAAWFKKDNLPNLPKKMTIARKMIDSFILRDN